MLVKESLSLPIISKIKKDDIPTILDMCAKIFDNVMSYNANISYLKSTVDWSISYKLTLDNKIIGCYLFNTQQINTNLDSNEDLSKYKNKKGIQGVALALLPKYRGLGYGKLLRDIPKSLPYDYIWGLHLAGLHNVDNWVNYGRRIVSKTHENGDSIYVTLMDLR